MQKFTKEWALQMLDLNPDWMAVWVDKDNSARWSTKAPIGTSVIDTFLCENGSDFGYLGQFTYDGHWKDTLVVRKCTHILHPNINWKYCPKCGELLGSK